MHLFLDRKCIVCFIVIFVRGAGTEEIGLKTPNGLELKKKRERMSSVYTSGKVDKVLYNRPRSKCLLLKLTTYNVVIIAIKANATDLTVSTFSYAVSSGLNFPVKNVRHGQAEPSFSKRKKKPDIRKLVCYSSESDPKSVLFWGLANLIRGAHRLTTSPSPMSNFELIYCFYMYLYTSIE